MPKPAKDKETADRIKRLALQNPESIEEAAAHLGMVTADALAFVEQHDAEITAEALRLGKSREALVTKSLALAVRAVDRFHADLDDMDVKEVSDVVKHALRVIENDDRVKLAQKDPYENLPVFHFNLTAGKGGAFTISAHKPQALDNAATVDVEAVEVPNAD